MIKRFSALFWPFLFSVISVMVLMRPCNATYGLCACAVQKMERQYNIPDNLLMAISLVESGRMIPKKGMVAWPWTINANGQSYMFPTKAEAVAKVRQLRASGITSIDVGCMQINLKHHPHAFASLEKAFDPDINVAYAAKFLYTKKTDTGSWHKAIGHYHSAVAHINAPYKSRVFKVWQKLQKTYTPGSFIPTVFTAPLLRHEGEYTTHLTKETGEKMPVRVQFGPYTGLQRGRQNMAPAAPLQSAPDAPYEQKNPIPLLRPTFFKINGNARRQATTPTPSKPTLQKASFRVKKRSANGFFALSR